MSEMEGHPSRNQALSHGDKSEHQPTRSVKHAFTGNLCQTASYIHLCVAAAVTRVSAPTPIVGRIALQDYNGVIMRVVSAAQNIIFPGVSFSFLEADRHRGFLLTKRGVLGSGY